MTSLINVAVTAYNNGEHIRECLNSIVSQKEHCDDFEVTIGYDRSSEDDTLSICKEFENNYNYIKIVYINKCFVGRVRNILAEETRCKYIYFVDGDDTLPKWAIWTLIDVIQKTDAECILGHMERVFPSGKRKVIPPFTNKPTICRAFIHPVLYKVDAYNKLRCMENIRTHEDRICGYMIPKFFSYKIIPDVIYNYHVRRASATRNRDRTQMIDDLCEVMERLKFYKNYFSNDEWKAIRDDLTWSAITTLMFAYDIDEVCDRHRRIVDIKSKLDFHFPAWTLNKKLLKLEKIPIVRTYIKLLNDQYKSEELAVFYDSWRMRLIKRLIEYKMYCI